MIVNEFKDVFQGVTIDRQEEEAQYEIGYYMKKSPKKKWIPGQIIREDDTPNSHWVKTDDGSVYRRTKFHLKKSTN